MEVGLSGRLTKCLHSVGRPLPADTLHLRDIATAITFWHSMRYNFGCMIASNTLFDSKGGFLGSIYPIKTADLEILRDAAMATIFWLYIYIYI